MILIAIFAILSGTCFESSPASQHNHEDTTWVLTAYADNRPIDGAQPTVQFEDDQVSGNANCNHYGGSYQIEGDSEDSSNANQAGFHYL
ncbi:MAG: META domain-containing protein [Chloroflexi bacterium]|nr:META domain-containing protein [Chloroflexota bacterium]